MVVVVVMVMVMAVAVAVVVALAVVVMVLMVPLVGAGKLGAPLLMDRFCSKKEPWPSQQGGRKAQDFDATNGL